MPKQLSKNTPYLVVTGDGRKAFASRSERIEYAILHAPAIMSDLGMDDRVRHIGQVMTVGGPVEWAANYKPLPEEATYPAVPVTPAATEAEAPAPALAVEKTGPEIRVMSLKDIRQLINPEPHSPPAPPETPASTLVFSPDDEEGNFSRLIEGVRLKGVAHPICYEDAIQSANKAEGQVMVMIGEHPHTPGQFAFAIEAPAGGHNHPHLMVGLLLNPVAQDALAAALAKAKAARGE